MTPRAPTRPARAALLPLALLAAGCAQQAIDKADGEYQRQLQRAGEFQAAARLPQREEVLVLNDELPRFARQSIPLQRAFALPPHIGRVSLHYPGRHSLASAAQLLSRLIDLPVIMTADALAGADAYAPRGGSTSTSTTTTIAGTTTTVTSTVPPVAVAASGPRSSNDDSAAVAAGARPLALPAAELQNTLELNHSGSLGSLLDRMARQAGLQWEYLDGKIVFSRMVTRAIPLKALPNGLSLKGSLDVMGAGGSGGGGSGSSGSGGGTSGSSGSGGGTLAVDFNVESDYWAGLTETLKSMVSPRAYLQADPRSGIVTVTDAVDNVERVEAYLKSFNAQLLRQVVLEVEVLQVNFTDDYANGINWTALVGKLSRNSLQFTLPTGKGSSTLSGNEPVSLTFSMKGSDGTNPTQAVVQALQEYGKVGTAYSSVVTTTNRMPVPIGALSTESYLSKVSPPTVSTTTGLTTVGGLEPGSVSTGFSMVLVPVILDSNRILLQSAMQISSLKEMKNFTSGVGNLQQTIQLPDVQRFVTLQRISVQAGHTLVLVGYETEQTQLRATDLIRGAVPTARSGTRTKTGTVILVTPRLTDQ